MPKTTTLLLAAGVSLLTLSGCGTFWNLNSKHGEGPRLPYGGIRNDVKQGVIQIAGVAEGQVTPAAAPLALGGSVYYLTLDLALSAVADTLVPCT
jgi:uncharacterized protein YceK